MRAAAAARGRAAAAVEQLELQARVRGLRGEPLLRLVQRPLARDEARVLARVRVAEHDQLAVAVGAQRVAVHGRVVELGHRLGRAAQVGERLEQGREAQPGPGAAREPQRREHVGRRAGHRHDHHGHGARAVGAAGQRDGVEHAQQLAADAVRPAPEPAAALGDRLLEQTAALVVVGVAVAGEQRRDGLLHHGGRLAHVEAGDVHPEDVDLPQQPPDLPVRDVLGAEAVEHEPEVVAQLLRVGVARLAGERVLHVDEPPRDEAELRAQRLVLAVRAPQHARRRHLGGVALERLEQRGRDGHAVARVREALGEPVDAALEQAQGGLAMERQRARERLGPDLRVAVHVRPGPRAERHLAPVGAHVEAALELLEHLGHGVVEDGLEEEEVAPDLVLDHRAHAPDLVGVPPDRQRLAQLGQQRTAPRAPDPRVVEPVEHPRHVELVVEHRAPGRLGGVGGEDEVEMQPAHGGGQIGARLAQHVGRLEQRLALPHSGGVVVAPPPHALALLGDVGELQLQRARADAGLEILLGQRVDELEQLRAGAVRAVAQLHGALVQPAHRLGELRAALLHEHVVEHELEQLGVALKAVDRGAGLGGRRRDRHRGARRSVPCAAPAHRPGPISVRCRYVAVLVQI